MSENIKELKFKKIISTLLVIAFSVFSLSSTTSIFNSLNASADSTTSSTPTINNVSITGSTLPNVTGINSFSGVSVAVNSTDLTYDNQLLDANNGLHWDDSNTKVIPLKGSQVSTMASDKTWGTSAPIQSVPMYSFNSGDSYEITNIGKTKSNKVVNIIATIKNNDSINWNTNKPNNQPVGISFYSSSNLQHNPDSSNNSIVVFYNGASNISINYKFVDSNNNPLTLLYSYIPNDIDFDQGIYSNFSNLGTFIPSNTNLTTSDDGIIYSKDTDLSLSGSSSLPNGGGI